MKELYTQEELDEYPEARSVVDYYRKKGQMTADNKQTLIKKGEPIYTMVQEYADLGPSIFRMDSDSFTEGQ